TVSSTALQFATSAPKAETRRIVRGSLGGRHTCESGTGVKVHIRMQGEQFLARGRYLKEQFYERLGRSEREATVSLWHLMTGIDSDSFVRPCERRKPL